MSRLRMVLIPTLCSALVACAAEPRASAPDKGMEILLLTAQHDTLGRWHVESCSYPDGGQVVGWANFQEKVVVSASREQAVVCQAVR